MKKSFRILQEDIRDFVDIVNDVSKRSSATQGRPVLKYPKTGGSFAVVYPSITEAARDLVENNESNGSPSEVAKEITKVCKGKRIAAYGYYWQYVDGSTKKEEDM